MALVIETLDRAVHDRAAFHCGEPHLDDFLRTRAAKHQAQRVSRTFVLINEAAPSRILGYYTLSNSHIARGDLSEHEARKLPKHPIPCVMLARLAIDRSAQGQRLGQHLLMDALTRCALVGQQSGVYALVVDAKNDAARRFYQRLGFHDIEGQVMRLYLPLATALKAIDTG